MTSMNTDDHDDGRGADVVSLDAARAARPGSADDGHAAPPLDAVTAAAGDPGGGATTDVPVLEGEVVRVDQPGPAGDWLADLAARARQRRPILHPALRSRKDALDTARWVAAHYAHVFAYHLVRLPLMAAKLCVYTPRGLARLTGGLVRWAFDLEGHPVRMAAVVKADPEAYLKLSRQRDARVRLRVWLTGAAAPAGAGVAAVAIAGPFPRAGR